ncbi:MAG: hypothetical protein COZ11_06305 [Deltaproteobacteria bacterium CG_4_10_14_3_um_filter_51_14]|nr:MAG: hypothetical protein COZ11_06305 [Deltaproteobacteria bacterium CG_4_10_14_3_um_filter_51_14]
MISMYLWQQVKALSSQGLRVKQIARKLRISKNTVKKYLRSEDSPISQEFERVVFDFIYFFKMNVSVI